MKWSTISTFTLLFAVMGCESTTAPPQQNTIPLSDIWAFDMPGTRDVRELEPDVYGRKAQAMPDEEQFRLLDQSIVQAIRKSLSPAPADGIASQPGFPVIGAGRDALNQTYEVLLKQRKSQSVFPLGEEITLAFFSHQFGDYIHLDAVERHGNTFEIQYHFVPHATREVTSHFALIPVGVLPVGKYEVTTIQLPSETELGRRIVCRPFSFSVVAE